MAHISGTFAHARAGRLRITLSGTFFSGPSRDSGFPTGPSNLMVRGVVNGNVTDAIDRMAPVVYSELDYPGGGAVWAVSTETQTNAFGGGTATYGFTNLRMILTLMKK